MFAAAALAGLTSAATVLAQSGAPTAPPGAQPAASPETRPVRDVGTPRTTAVEPANPDRIPEANPFQTSLRFFGQVGARSDEKNGAGSLGFTKAGGELNVAYRLSEDYTLTLGLGATHSYYSFAGTTSLSAVSTEPFNDLWQTEITPGIRIKFDDDWSGFFSGRLSFSGENNTNAGEGMEAGGFALINYRISDKLVVGGGIGASSRIEASAVIIPILSINWQVADNITLRSRRLGAEVAVDLTKQLTTTLGVEFNRQSFRLSEDSRIFKGVVRDKSLSVELGVVYRATPWLTASVFGGAMLQHSIVLDNQYGYQLGKLDAKPAPYIGGSLEFRF